MVNMQLLVHFIILLIMVFHGVQILIIIDLIVHFVLCHIADNMQFPVQIIMEMVDYCIQVHMEFHGSDPN